MEDSTTSRLPTLKETKRTKREKTSLRLHPYGRSTTKKIALIPSPTPAPHYINPSPVLFTTRPRVAARPQVTTLDSTVVFDLIRDIKGLSLFFFFFLFCFAFWLLQENQYWLLCQIQSIHSHSSNLELWPKKQLLSMTPKYAFPLVVFAWKLIFFFFSR